METVFVIALAIWAVFVGYAIGVTKNKE